MSAPSAPEGAHGRREGKSPATWLLACPEANLFFFGFLVHYPWEFLQVPLFSGLAQAPHWEAVKFCSLAALGDAGLTVLAYWLAATTDGRRWILELPRRAVTVYLAAGLLATVFLEWLNGDVLGRWEYAEAMPTLPLVGTGLSPVVQWMLLPLVVLFVVRRQLRGSGRWQ